MSSFAKVAGGHGVRRENDDYPTPGPVTRALLHRETFPNKVWEPAAGAGYLARELSQAGYNIVASDLVRDGKDFLNTTKPPKGVNSIVTNPPFKLAGKFIRKAIDFEIEKHAWLLRFQFIEGSRRYQLFKQHPPRTIWIFTKRVQINYSGLVNPCGGLIVFGWWVWERGFKSDHIDIKLIKPTEIASNDMTLSIIEQKKLGLGARLI